MVASDEASEHRADIRKHGFGIHPPDGLETPARRILFGVTTDQSLVLLKGFPEHMLALGWDVHVVTSPGANLDLLREVRGLTVHEIPMTRKPSLVRDVRALLSWFRLLRSVQPGIISVGTPKAGLLGTLAGFLARVPVRVYILRGLRSESTTGMAQRALNTIEKFVCWCATDVVCVSPSLREVAMRYRLASASKLQVLGHGSSNGVETVVTLVAPHERVELRRRYFSGPPSPVIGFIGRLAPAKGLETLAAAIRILASEGRRADCLIIGGDDGPASADLRHQLDIAGWRVFHTGHVNPVTAIAQLMDVLCLPSLREGFPNVVLEAAVLGIACVGSDATGVRDAILDGETGLTFRSGDPNSLADQLRRILSCPELALRLGVEARIHALARFNRRDVWTTNSRFYETLLRSASRRKK